MNPVAIKHLPDGYIVVDMDNVMAVAHVVLTDEKGQPVAKQPAILVHGEQSVKMFAVKSVDNLDLEPFLRFTDSDNDPVYVRPGMIEIVATSNRPGVFIAPADIYIRGSNRALSVSESVESVTAMWMKGVGMPPVDFPSLDSVLPVDINRILGRPRGTPNSN